MVNKKRSVLCIVLALMLVLSALVVGTGAASAASGDTIYVKLNNGWSDVYCYMWYYGTETNNKSWPGVQMTKVADGVYSYTVTADYDRIIFNNGSSGDGNQTGDLTYTGNGGDGKIYDLSTGTWSDYQGATTATKATTATTATTVTTATTATSATTATTVTGDFVVYLKNEAGWSKPYCYAWTTGSSDQNKTWPGVAMTSVGDDVYMYTASTDYKYCIFNDNGGTQTGNLTAQSGYIYNNSTGTWEVYDTSPLQVSSYSIDPSSGIYTDTDITVSTSAKNTESGASVSYKISVTNSSGTTSVLSDYSATNSLVWTPTVADTYTITFDYKDDDGNTNQRTLSVTVNDDSSLVKPVIKGVTPGNLNYVKVNASATVSVKAGGGNTGTNLLFYKYVVVDPNGAKNTPYYTLSSTYSFTPTATGTYTVTVYVQGSDNSTVNKTYTYTAIDGELPTSATQQTTTKGTVLGDANHNGDLDIDDVTYIQKYLADMSGYTVTVSECDMDGDNNISIMDCTIIQKILAGITV